MSSLRKLAGQTAIYGFSSIIGRLVIWGFTPILTQYMHPGEYGIFSDLYAFITYFLVILTFGMETAYFRFAKTDKSDKRAYDFSFNLIFILGLAFLLLFSGANPFFSNLLGYPGRTGLLWLITMITFLDVITALPMAKLRYDERPLVFAGISLAGIFVNVLLNIWFFVIQEQKTAEYVFLANLIASAFRMTLLVVFSLPFQKWLPSIKLKGLNVLPSTFRLDKTLLVPIAGFGAFIMVAGLLGMITQNSDVNFIKRIWGDAPRLFGEKMFTGGEMAGIFSANKKLAVLILLVTQAFRYAAEPFFFRHNKESQDRGIYAKVFHYFMLASMGTGLLISCFSFELVSFKIFGFQLINEKYWSGLDAVPLMLCSFILFGAYTNFSIWYKLSKQVRFGLFFSLVGSLIIVILNILLIGKYGYTGANIATFLGYVVMTLLTYFIGQKYFPIPYNIGRILIYAGSFLLAWYASTKIGSGHFGDLIFFKKLFICCCSFFLVYLAERMKPLSFQTQVNP